MHSFHKMITDFEIIADVTSGDVYFLVFSWSVLFLEFPWWMINVGNILSKLQIYYLEK